MSFYTTPWAAGHHESATVNVAQLTESVDEDRAASPTLPDVLTALSKLIHCLE